MITCPRCSSINIKEVTDGYYKCSDCGYLGSLGIDKSITKKWRPLITVNDIDFSYSSESQVFKQFSLHVNKGTPFANTGQPIFF